MKNKFLYWIGIIGETVAVGGFYTMILLLGISYLGLIEEKSLLLKTVGIISVCLISGTWFMFRYRGYRQGKYYLEDFKKKKSE